MKKYFINSLEKMIVMIFFIRDKSQSLKKQLKVQLEVENNGNTMKPVSDQFVNLFLVENKTLDIEFLERSDSVEINISDRFGNIMHNSNILTVPTLHIFIDVDHYSAGLYFLRVDNPCYPYLVGCFEVKEDIHYPFSA